MRIELRSCCRAVTSHSDVPQTPASRSVPGFEPDAIVEYLKNGLVPAAMVCTHGRSDHIAGNAEMKRRWPECPIVIGVGDAIHNKLFTRRDDTIVYPGHGLKTTIGREKRSNPFVGAPAGYTT